MGGNEKCMEKYITDTTAAFFSGLTDQKKENSKSGQPASRRPEPGKSQLL
jgi:hypothetical protein